MSAIERRRFLAMAAIPMLGVPSIVTAQSPRKQFLIGLASISHASYSAGADPKNPFTRAFLQKLSELGYVYGKDFVTEVRGTAGAADGAARAAAELVALKPDVIVAAGPTLAALKQATATIPIVMAASADPVGQGFVQSLGRPGGNITGLTHQSAETTGKRLQLLKELLPNATRVAVMWDQQAGLAWQAAQLAAQPLAMKLLSFEIGRAEDIDAAFGSMRSAKPHALLVETGAIAYAQRKHIVELAVRARIPAMYDLRPYVEVGGLLSYSADLADIWRRAAVYVDKILKGANPAELPVEQPTSFELAINAKAARTLAIALPESMKVQAQIME